MIELAVDEIDEVFYPPLPRQKNVHTEHCCVVHGCKYGDEYCPVYIGVEKQSYPCESCYTDINEDYPYSNKPTIIPSIPVVSIRVIKARQRTLDI